MAFIKTGDDVGMNVLDPEEGGENADDRKCPKCGRKIIDGEEHGECKEEAQERQDI